MKVILWIFIFSLSISCALAQDSDEVKRYGKGLYQCIDNVQLSEPCSKNIFSFIDSLPEEIARKMTTFLQHYLHHDYFKDRCTLSPLEVIAADEQVCNIFVQENDLFILLSDYRALLYEKGEKEPILFLCMDDDIRLLQLLPKSVVAGLECGDLVFYEEENDDHLVCCNSAITSLTFTLDGFLLVGSSSGEICMVNSETKQVEHSMISHNGAVTGIIDMLDGGIISCSLDGTIKQWSCNKKVLNQVLYQSQSPITHIVQKDNQLIVCLQSGQIELIDKNTGVLLNVLSGHADVVTAVAITALGNIITTSRDHTIKIWHPSINNSIFSFDVHDDIYALIVNRNGNIISGSKDNVIKIWNCEDLSPFGVVDLLQLILLIKIETEGRIHQQKRLFLSSDWHALFQTLPLQLQKYYGHKILN